jgi:hypothetical protein
MVGKNLGKRIKIQYIAFKEDTIARTGHSFIFFDMLAVLTKSSYTLYKVADRFFLDLLKNKRFLQSKIE